MILSYPSGKVTACLLAKSQQGVVEVHMAGIINGNGFRGVLYDRQRPVCCLSFYHDFASRDIGIGVITAAMIGRKLFLRQHLFSSHRLVVSGRLKHPG